MQALLQKLKNHHDLNAAEITNTFSKMFSGALTESDVQEFLTLLHQKGESTAEILAAVQFLKGNAVNTLQAAPDVVDCCGTGGDQLGTLNISTAVALVLAGGGVPVAKHGNAAVSSKSGSADVLQALGVVIDLSPAAARTCLEQCGITFLLAPLYYPLMQQVRALRKKIPHPTIFNLLGPLLNPMSVKRQVLGVYNESYVHRLAEVLLALGHESSIVVHAQDGLDEFSLSAPAVMSRVVAGQVTDMIFDPWQESGYPRCEIADLRGGTATENALRIRQSLKGHSQAVDHVIHINAAWGFVVAGRAATFLDGLLLAQDSVSSGRAYQKLQEWVEVSRALQNS